MNLDISKMNGYEFESFVADLLRKMGFVVEETKFSRDSGVDLIAYSNQPLFKGKYLVQCKKWEGSVGEPPLRDLYGVVLSNKANKGILVTSSYFTMQAVHFADEKNLELIDGSMLNELVIKYYGNDYVQMQREELQTVHFTNLTEFELTKYQFYKQRVDSDKRSFDVYLDLFNFMYAYVLDHKLDIMYSGLLIELLQIVNELIKRFGTSGKKGEYYKKIFTTFKGIFLMLLGRVSEAVEILATMENLGFTQYTGEFDANYVMNSCYYFYPHRYYVDRFEGKEAQYKTNISDIDFLIYKVNLISLLNSINDGSGLNYLVEKFHQYYDNINANKNNMRQYFQNEIQALTILSEYNIPLVKQSMEDAIVKGKGLFFLPLSFTRYRDKDSFPYIDYSIDKYLKLEDIKPHWFEELDFEAQKQRIDFLFSLVN